MENHEKEIPSEFYNENNPTAETVGELIEILKKLPSELLVEGTFGDPVKVCVYHKLNEDGYECIVCIEEDD